MTNNLSVSTHTPPHSVHLLGPSSPAPSKAGPDFTANLRAVNLNERE